MANPWCSVLVVRSMYNSVQVELPHNPSCSPFYTAPGSIGSALPWLQHCSLFPEKVENQLAMVAGLASMNGPCTANDHRWIELCVKTLTRTKSTKWQAASTLKISRETTLEGCEQCHCVCVCVCVCV